MIATRFVTGIATIAVVVALAACGGGGEAAQDSGHDAKRADVVFGDCSSFRKYSRQYLAEMLAVAQDTATRERVLYAGCFDGAPVRTLKWQEEIDFGEELPGVAEQDRERVNQARALGLREKFRTMLRRRPKVRGSGQLEALELASQTAGVGRVWMFTDAIIKQLDGVDLATADAAEIRRVVARWVPRMKNGLRGVPIAFVGVGRGAGSTAQVRTAARVLRGVATGAGAVASWSQTLPPIEQPEAQAPR